MKGNVDPVVYARKGHVGEDLLRYFTERDSYSDNPYIVKGTFNNLPYHECVGKAESIVEEMRKSHDKDYLFNALNKLEALEYQMDDLRKVS